MIKLADYQRALMQSLLEPDKVSDNIQAVIVDQSTLSQRLAVYQNSILGGRFAVLQQIFVCVEKLVGVDYFQQMAEQFLQAFPSSNVAIAAMGEQFGVYIAKHDVMQHVPYIADMAQLDWQWYQVFHGRNNAAIDVNEIPSSATVCLALDARLLSSCFPLHKLWEMCQPEYQGEYQLPEEESQYYFVIVQREQMIRIEPISKAEWQVLQQLPSASNKELVGSLRQRGCIILNCVPA